MKVGMVGSGTATGTLAGTFPKQRASSKAYACRGAPRGPLRNTSAPALESPKAT